MEPRDTALRDGVAAAVGVDPVAGPVPVPDRLDPLACARELTAHGLGPLDGRSVAVARPVALRVPTGGRVVLEADGYPLAALVERAGHTVVLCASPSARDVLTGRRFTPSTGPHPAPLVVEAHDWRVDPPPGVAVDDPAFVTAAAHAARRLPAAVHDALVDFADAPPPSGALLVRGVPVGDVPPTPDRPTDHGGDKGSESEFALLTAARRLGHPVGYAPELGGRIVQDIVPTADSRFRQVSTSSAVSLDWHTEAAFHPHRPRYLTLLCLRGDDQAATLLCSVRHLVEVLDPSLVDELRRPAYRTAVDESYLGSRPTRRGTPRPVVHGPPGNEFLWFDADLMSGTDEGAREALTALREAVENHHVAVTLTAGDLLVVDNDLAVHGRTPFTARFDGTDRWLQRSFVVADLTPSAAERTGAVVDTWFLP